MSDAPTWPIGFYAPGHYACVCDLCKKSHVADKRAVHCADCTLQACYREVERLRVTTAQPATVTSQEAARVLLDAMARSQIEPFDPIDTRIEALAIKHSGNRGDPVIQLEIAEEFFTAALRALAGDKT